MEGTDYAALLDEIRASVPESWVLLHLQVDRSPVAAGGQQVRTYYGFDRPDVEVLVDGTWWPGVLRAWTQDDDDTWHGNVEYRDNDGTRSATFPADRIRHDTVDRSHGRDS